MTCLSAAVAQHRVCRKIRQLVLTTLGQEYHLEESLTLGTKTPQFEIAFPSRLKKKCFGNTTYFA